MSSKTNKRKKRKDRKYYQNEGRRRCNYDATDSKRKIKQNYKPHYANKFDN